VIAESKVGGTLLSQHLENAVFLGYLTQRPFHLLKEAQVDQDVDVNADIPYITTMDIDNSSVFKCDHNLERHDNHLTPK
jgi:hypothetical protein